MEAHALVRKETSYNTVESLPVPLKQVSRVHAAESIDVEWLRPHFAR